LKRADELNIGERAVIKDIDNAHPSAHRILEIGFTPGQEIELLNSSAFNDPLAFAIRGTIIAIRKKEANCIHI
jgi:ferrous iron transport protein A